MLKILNKVKSILLKNKAISIIAAIILIFAITMGISTYFEMQKNRMIEQIKSAQEVKGKNISKLYYEIESDLVIGNKNAPVTIIEYASLSCPHCANFYNKVFDKIEEKYIKTGKVKFIYRDFPLNQSALLASVISKCKLKMDNNVEQYYKFIKTLFKNQNSWAFGEDIIEKLRSLSILNGLNSDKFTQCMNDKELVESILEERMRSSQELKIQSTPTFIINGNLIGGYHDFESFEEAIEAEL